MNLGEAESHAHLGLPVPEGARRRLLKRAVARLSWFFLHHQVAFNTEVIEALNKELEGETGLRAHLDHHEDRLDSHEIAQGAIAAKLDELGSDLWSAVAGQSSQLDSRAGDLWTALAAQSTQVEALGGDLWEALSAQGAAITVLAERLDRNLDERAKDLWDALSAQGAAITVLAERLDRNLAERAEDLWDALSKVSSAVIEARDVLDQGLVALKIHVDLMQRQAFSRHHEGIGDLRTGLGETSLQIRDVYRQLDDLYKRLEATSADMDAKLAEAAAETRRRRGSADALLDRIRRTLPEPVSAREVAGLPDTMAALYPDFEDAFRGPLVSVTEAVKDYLPDISSLDRHGPVVDLGSGRGEWLEVLKQADVEAYGVDLSEDFVEQCQARGLKVVLADVCEHLEQVPERSLSAVTAFHLAEHLPVETLIRLIDLSVRALEPGGLLILETPNPDNVIVGASSFYLDPSHVRPLPPGLLAFLVEARGFSQVETRLLHPSVGANLSFPEDSAPWAGDLGPLVDVINTRLFGPQDYAVIGRRL